MIKKLLILIFASFSTGLLAQSSCLNALQITNNGTFTTGTINGTAPTVSCYSAVATAARWYKFTPSQSGVITINSAIAANPLSIDSRLSIYTGTCSGLVCYAVNDDVSATDFRAKITDRVVSAGTTYYIVWDNRWSSTSFSFDFSFTPMTCFLPTAYSYVGQPGLNSVSISWTPSTLSTATGFEIEYGLRGFTPGTGTTITTTATNYTFTSLSPNTVYEFYLRTNCGSGDYSAWTSPISFNTAFNAATLPYTTSFEDTQLSYIGWDDVLPANATTNFQTWQINVGATGNTLSRTGTNLAYCFANSSAEGTTNAWLMSRPLNITQPGTVNVSYYVRNYLNTNATGSSTYEVKAGTGPTIEDMIINVAAQSTVSSTTYALKSHTFTAPTAGVYYIGIKNNSSTNDVGKALFVEDFSVSMSLSDEEFEKNTFRIYPNPSSDFIQINSKSGISQIQIFDLNGRMIKMENYVTSTNISVDIQDLNTGNYMIKLISEDGEKSEMIIKK